MKRETTRIREQGTIVTMPEEFINAEEARLDALRQIVDRKQYAVIDGTMIDLFSASCILQVYENLNLINQERYLKMPAGKMAIIAYKLMNKS